MKKVFVAVMFTVLLFISIVIAYSSTQMKIEADSVNANAGQNIEVPINLKNNSGIAVISIDLEYDKTIMTFESATNGEVFSNEELSVSKANARLNWVSSDMENISKNGVLANLVFSINQDCASIDTLIHLNVTQAFNENLDDVEIATTDICLHIQGVDKKVKSIQVDKPNKLSYKTGDSLDLSGMKVWAKYDDGSTSNVMQQAQVSELDSSSPGEKIIKVTYKGFASSFAVKVLPNNDILSLKIDSDSCTPGSTVQIPIVLEENPGITGVSFDIVYDNEKMSLMSVVNGDVFERSHLSIGGDTNDMPYKVMWENGTATVNNENIGTLAYLNFSLKDNASAGEYDVALANVKSIDKNIEVVDTYIENGKAPMYSKKYLLGDTNSNGIIDLRDATVIQMYIANYPVSKYGKIDLDAADCDESGSVSIKDATLIQKILVGLVIDDKYETYKYT